MNEWEFTSDIASAIKLIMQKAPRLPLADAQCEQQTKGSRKRRDLTFADQNGRIVLTGEIKLPYQTDGSSPFNNKVVRDAREKARAASSEYFFTWNVNEFVLWRTDGAASWETGAFKNWKVTEARTEAQLESAGVRTDIRTWLDSFLTEFSRILIGTSEIGIKTPDERFVEVLESSLSYPVYLTNAELSKRYSSNEKEFTRIDDWMRQQGWTITKDIAGIRENLDRAAKFSCYAVVNKIVFHEALLKRYSGKIKKLTIPKHIDTGDALRTHIEGFFERAKRATGDYETVFGEDHKSYGNRIPFLSDDVVSHWRELVDRVHEFDFTKLDVEVIGTVFERLIGPEERKKYGQFYTRTEVVDLINSFCIKTGDEKVMDPACGGGTFLVRAYVRKKELSLSKEHGELLNEIFGVDIAGYPTQLTTINLATRDLVDEENYPCVTRRDFLDLKPETPLLRVPVHKGGKTKLSHRDILVPKLDAMIGNLPYVRQEEIRKAKDKKKPQSGTKEYYKKQVAHETMLSGRSDLHCYFWPYSRQFLKDDGYICFLTSSQWLDVEYGFKLQNWILKNCEIVAVIESIDEPWFVGARVVTTVTILRLQNDPTKRIANKVKFVQLRKPIRELLSNDGTSLDAIEAADRLRDEILSCEENLVNDRYRIRVIGQGDLWKQGVELGRLMKNAGVGEEPDEEEEEDVNGNGEYYGGKWGVYLRAPDIWFELLDNYGDKLVPLGKVARIKYGIKSGKDDFFYPIDASEQCLQEFPKSVEFRQEFGVPRDELETGRIKLVWCGEKREEIRPIEAKYLEPEIHSLMEINNYFVTKADCGRLILLVDKPKEKINDKYVKAYIKWGEEQGIHRNATCAARAKSGAGWYDLTGQDRSTLLWAKERQYRQIAPLNLEKLAANCRLYEIHPYEHTEESDYWGGVLNSTLSLFSCFQYGRPVGNEGNWSTMVVDVNAMLIPIVPSASARKNIARAFAKLRKRSAIGFVSEQRLRRMSFEAAGKSRDLQFLSTETELDLQDRIELDTAVFSALVPDPSRSSRLMSAVYAHIREYFEMIRQKEEKAILNKAITARKAGVRPDQIAKEIIAEIAESEPALLRKYDTDFIDLERPFDTFDLPLEGEPEDAEDMLIDAGVRFVKGRKRIAMLDTRHKSQSALIVEVAQHGTRGFVPIPVDKKECERLHRRYSQFISEREARLQHLVEERTSDEHLQEKVYHHLIGLVLGSI